MLTKLRQIFLPNAPAAPNTITINHGLTVDDLATLRALTAYSDGATAAEAMAVFRGEAA